MHDLRTNMDISSGHCRCHSSLDLDLTPSGDLALVDGIEEMRQRFLLYLATPKGERIDPSIGSFAYDYLHEKNTSGNMRRMEQDVMSDFKTQFPEITAKSVTCIQSLTDPFQTEVAVKLSNGDMRFLYSPEELMAITTFLSNIVSSGY